MSDPNNRQPDLAKALARLDALQPVQRGTLTGITLIDQPPFRLKHFPTPPDISPPFRQPLLLVYSLVNRPDLLDLSLRRSMVRALMHAGFPIYLVDWGYPLDADRFLDLEDYVDGFLKPAVTMTLRHAGATEEHGLILTGICQGGTLSLCLAARHQRGIGGLALFGTPIDFHAVRHPLGLLADLLPATPDNHPDNIPGSSLSLAFTSLKPVDLLLRRYRKLARFDTACAEELEEFLRIEAWMYDCPDQPGRMFHRFIQDFYRDNRLIRDTLEVGNETVRLSNLAMPILNVYATDDHLVPAAMSRALSFSASTSLYRECVVPGGHLGLFLSARSQRRWLPEIIRLGEMDDQPTDTRKQAI